MAREGTPAETRLNLEPLEEQAEGVPPWSLSPHLQPPRRAPTEGRGGAEDAVELGQGELSAEGAGVEARRLRENRDPKAVNSCLKVAFEDVIAEPASVRSFDRVWVWSHALFEVSRVWCYRLISLLLAVPVSLVAGLLMALLSCLHIWLIMPCLQLCVINMRWVQVLWASVLNIAIGPFFTSMGKCCGSISIRIARD
ncbi:caveolin-2-like [Gadus chalcogrammus]|uniref:caveolin-2-like n=1 Tax=Gadus chalcogrammus TaxID=1042646 RepID=UPI0024C4BFA0|nr:caveolin-2-like [Gadus chalcogrammus]